MALGDLVQQRSGGAVPVIIPTWNKLGLLRQCLNSLGEGAHPIVVSNGCTDGTQRAELKATIIRLPHNRGFAAASNMGAREARGEVYVFMNNDCVAKPGWLSLLKHFDDPSVGAVQPLLVYPSGRIQSAGMVTYRQPGPRDPRGYHLYFRNRWKGRSANRAGTIRECQCLTGACLCVRATLFWEAGGFDERFWNGYEDVDLCFKLLNWRYKLIYDPSVRVIHRENSTSRRERRRRTAANRRLCAQLWQGRIRPEFETLQDAER